MPDWANHTPRIAEAPGDPTKPRGEAMEVIGWIMLAIPFVLMLVWVFWMMWTASRIMTIATIGVMAWVGLANYLILWDPR